VAKVPTAVSELVTTLEFKVLPLNVPAAAVTVIAADPSKLTPFIALAVVNVAAVVLVTRAINAR
jgi:hypothetical protein